MTELHRGERGRLRASSPLVNNLHAIHVFQQLHSRLILFFKTILGEISQAKLMLK